MVLCCLSILPPWRWLGRYDEGTRLPNSVFVFVLVSHPLLSFQLPTFPSYANYMGMGASLFTLVTKNSQIL